MELINYKKTINSIHIIEIFGSWYEMGLQYGELLKEQLNEVYEICYTKKILKNEKQTKIAITQADKLYETNNHKIKCFFDGMSKKSGLSLEQLKLINAIEYNIGISACSCLVVNDDFSKNGLIWGRNYDYSDFFKALKNDLVVTIFHPNDSSLNVATVGYAGEIYAVNGINQAGLFIELNNASPSGGNELCFDKLAGTSQLLQLLFDADNIDYVDNFFATCKSNFPYIIGVSDDKQGYSYEWNKEFSYKTESTINDGYMAFTNTFKNSHWTFAQPTDQKSWRSITRMQNMSNFAKKSQNNFDAQKMAKHLETTIQDGGPKFPDLTVYQLVWDAKNKQLWIKVIDDGDWIQLDMKKYLHMDI